VLKKREEQRLEAAQMKYLRYLFGITKLDKKPMYYGKNRSREYSEGNKTVPGKVATTHTEDGLRQDT
jgi:beta-N-acetylglucosaminidase